MRRRQQQLAVLAALGAVVLLAACGARLSDSERSLAIRHGAPVAGATQNAAPGVETTGGPASDQPGAGSGPITSGNGPGIGTSSAGPATNGGSGPAKTGTQPGSGPTASGPTCDATSKNNGGATDTGVTATTIKVGNISDISGPVAGLFSSAEQAALAYLDYFNTTHPDGVCGRKLVYDPADSATDSGTDRSKTEDACSHDFAIVGSQSAFDDGGVGPIQSCGLTDIPAIAVTTQRQANPGTFSANAASTRAIAAVVPDYFKKHFGSVVKHAAFLYINVGAAGQNAAVDIKAYEKAGWHWTYTAGLPPQSATTQGFKPYVQKIKQGHAQLLIWLGAYQEAADLAQAVSESDYHPKVFLLDPTGYNPQYIQQAGSSSEGTYIYDDAVPLSHVGRNAELDLYLQWLQRTGASAPPSYFGQYAWSAMALFTDMLYKVGPHLTRAAMNSELTKVHHWTDHGMHSSMDVGGKRAGGCNGFVQVRNGKFVDVTKGFICDRLITP
jgi:substrate-binding family protein